MHGGVLSRSDGAVRPGRDDPASDWKNQLPQQCFRLEGPVGCTHGDTDPADRDEAHSSCYKHGTRRKVVRRMSVLLEKRSNGVAVITLNRPQVLNALDVPAKERLGSIWQEIADDPGVRVAILTGAGEKAFCAGSDIKEINRTGRMVTTEILLRAIPGVGVPLVKPVIAALHGYCIGMGMTLALHCDLRLAAKGAVLGYPEVRHGMISAVSALHLPQVIPSAQALEMLLIGRNIPAEEAWRWGLVNAVVDDVAAEAERWAATIAGYSPKSKPCERWLRRTTITRKARPHFPAADDHGVDEGRDVP
jgi:enoyl-CoA hydratase/carnithine racemase